MLCAVMARSRVSISICVLYNIFIECCDIMCPYGQQVCTDCRIGNRAISILEPSTNDRANRKAEWAPVVLHNIYRCMVTQKHIRI